MKSQVGQGRFGWFVGLTVGFSCEVVNGDLAGLIALLLCYDRDSML